MDGALLSRVERQAWFHRYPRGIPFALFCLVLAFTATLIYAIETANARAERIKLERDAIVLSAGMKRMATENEAYMRAAAALFSIKDNVSPAEFARLVSDMSADALARGSLGVGWAQWTTAADAGEQAQRLRLFHPAAPSVAVRPVPADPTTAMAVITLLEPATEANRKAIGYNMYAEPVRRDAINRAVATRRPTLSGLVHLVQDDGDSSVAGALIYVPVYPVTATGERGSNLRGLVYSPIRVKDFLVRALSYHDRPVESIAVYDQAVSPGRLLAAVGGVPGGKSVARGTVNFGDRQWIVVVGTNSAFTLSPGSRIVLASGIIIGLLLLAVAWYMTARASDDRRVLEWLSDQAQIRTTLTRELNHRVKNTLANVLSIIALTHRRAADLPGFVDTLTARIRALSATHDLLSQREWSDAPVADVVANELAPYLTVGDGQAKVSGPPVLLAPNDAMSLGLALHELSTNAAKYGALSVPEGRVQVTWSVPSQGLCVVRWVETGGPAVTPASRRGFGLDLIEKIVGQQLRQTVDVRFDPGGVRCTIPVPIRVSGEFAIRNREPAQRVTADVAG